MTGTAHIAPVQPSGAGSIRISARRIALPALAAAAAALAMILLATQANGEMLDYGVGVVPALVPWLAVGLCVATAAVALSGRGASSTAVSLLMGALVPWLAVGLCVAMAAVALRVRGASSTAVSLLMGALAITTAWSVTMLPFDALRIVGLVPLPLSGWGLALRLLLLVAGAAAVVPVLRARRARQARCGACGRVMPGRLDRVPRWPAVVAVVFALPYPVLRVAWALGGTFGTSGEPMDLEPAVAWGAAAVGACLVAFTLFLLIGLGPRWARALFGLGGLVAGVALTVVGGLAASLALTGLATDGLESSQGDLMTWTFLLVYGSWFLAGLGVIAASWRFWARRREDCPACRTLLGP